jgi:hypothetical protein
MSDRISRPFSELHQSYKPDTLLGFEVGGDKHLRADTVQLSDGTPMHRLYMHEGMSGFGEQAMQNRMTKWADGAAFVKQSIDIEYGPGIGDLVFQKILEDGGPDLSKELRRRDLNTIQAKITEMTSGSSLLQKFTDRGLTDVESAQSHAANMFTAVRSMSNEDANTINQRLLGGGNYALRTVFNHPEILNIQDDQDRIGAFEGEFDSLTNPALDFMGHQIDQNALDPRHAYFGASQGALDDMKLGQKLAIDVTRSDAGEFLSDPDNVEKTRGFVEMSTDLNLQFEDAMAVVRSRQNIRSVALDEVQAAIEKLFAGGILTKREEDMVDYLFPGTSS